MKDANTKRSSFSPSFSSSSSVLHFSSATEEKDKNRLKVEGGKGIPPKVAERPRHSSFSNLPKGPSFASSSLSSPFLLLTSFSLFSTTAFDADKMIPLRKSSLPIDPIYVAPRGSRTNQSRRRALARSALSFSPFFSCCCD